MTGGSLGALYQPAELVIIPVQGLGRLSSAIMAKRLKAREGAAVAVSSLQIHQSNVYGLLALLYRLMAKSRQMGMFSLNAILKIPVRARSSPATHASFG